MLSRYFQLGYSVVKLRPNSKKPVGEWERWMRERLSLEMVQDWPGNNGVVCGSISGNLVVKDFDSKEPAREWYKLHRKVLKTIVETRKGVHFYYRWEEGKPPLTKFPHGDIKGEGSYVVAPGSVVDGWTYRFVEGHTLVRPEELPVFDPSWIPKRKEVQPIEDEIMNRIVRAREYIAKVEGAVSGQRGHDKTMYVAGRLIQFFRLSIDQALPLILEWNEKCVPPWGTRQLLHKLESAVKNGK